MNIHRLIKQKSYERIVYVLRRHPITFFPNILLFVFLLIIPTALVLLVINLFPDVIGTEVGTAIVTLIASAFYLMILVVFYTQFTEFYLDMWFVTNDRIIDVEQLGLFARTISEVDLFRIQDVTTDVHGVFPTIFKYGVVSVKTASNNRNIVFYNVYKPNVIREHLIQLAHEDRKFHYHKPAEQ